MNTAEQGSTAHVLADCEYRHFFHALPGRYLVLNPDLIIVTANQAYLDATMKRLEDIVGMHMFDVFPDNPDFPDADGVAKLGASLERVKAMSVPDTMALQRYDIARPLDDGGGFEERYWCPVNVPVLIDGAVRYIIHRVEDVTEVVRQGGHDQASPQMGRLATETAQAVARQVRELQRSRDELDQVIAQVGHDLRAPLRSIDLSLSLLEDRVGKDADEDAPGHLQQAQAGVERLHDMLESLLCYAQSGNAPLQREPVDCTALLRVVRSNLTALIQETDALIAIPPDLPTVTGERMLLLQLFQNLVGNALVHRHPDRRPRVDVSCDQVGEEWHFSVADNGRGIEAEQAEQLFRPFERGSESNGPGTGLGLAICWQVVQRHGGRIWVESQPGAGSRLVVALPGSGND